ncbi:MAG: copper resistance protein NlpE N-terminal domain-containing protein [Candidatus Azobacteroides sp.]|nr:copper resistance protein NlpE N-terminal domain-containing protein [Candidatus Azobacteroides sp.]
MKRILVSMCCIVGVLLISTSCKKTKGAEDAKSPVSNAEQLVYVGDIPCADCEGIHTVLVLKLNNDSKGNYTYELTQVYKGKQPENKFVEKGNYNVEKGLKDKPDAKVYVLAWDDAKAQRRYFAEYDNDSSAVYMLDIEGLPIESSLNYKLELVTEK